MVFFFKYIYSNIGKCFRYGKNYLHLLYFFNIAIIILPVWLGLELGFRFLQRCVRFPTAGSC